VEGVVFTPKFFDAEIVVKKAAVVQEANRVRFGNYNPVPFGAGALGNSQGGRNKLEKCYYDFYTHVNSGLTDARSTRSRSSMVGMDAPTAQEEGGPTEAEQQAWDDYVCGEVKKGADAALENARWQKKKAKAKC
jgi:hypothetical protein